MTGFQLLAVTALLGASAYSLMSKEQDQRLHLIHADIFERSKKGGKLVQELRGNVALSQGETTIYCQRAVQQVDTEIYQLTGNVRIYDENKTLFADTVMVFERDNRQVASGHVISISDGDTTRADRITYYEKLNKVVSEGSVKIIDPDKKTTLAGDVADYYRDTDFGVITDNATMVQYDSLWIEQTRIVADTMKIWSGGEETEAIDNVLITKPKIQARCGVARYFEKLHKIVLTEEPVVEQKNQEIQGDTLLLFLEDNKLSEAQVVGNARAVSEADTLQPGRWQNSLSGQMMHFYFANEEIEKAIIDNQATSVYHIVEDEQYKGANELSGDRIIVHFEKGNAQRVIVSSDPDVAAGSFQPAK